MFIRLMKYLRPYRGLAILSLLALLLSTVAELLVPVVLQTTVDNQLIPQFVYAQVLDNTDLTTLDKELYRKNPQDIVLSGNFIFIKSQIYQSNLQDRSLSSSARGILQTIDPSDLVVPIDTSQEGILEEIQNGGLAPSLLGNGNIKGIPLDFLGRLSSGAREVVFGQSIDALGRSAMYLLGLSVFSLVFTFGQIFLTAKLGQGVMKDLRLELFGHLLGQKMGYIQDVPVGTMVSRVTNDVETINELFTSVLTSLIKDLAVMVGVIVTLFVLDQKLGYVALATLPPVLIATDFFRKKARDAYRKVRHWVSEVNRYLSEHLSGMSIIHAFVKEHRVIKEFEERNSKLMKANLGEMYIFAVFRPLVDLLSTISVAIVIFFGARFYFQASVSLGILIAFINLIRKFYEPVMDMSEKFTILQSALAGSERVFGVLDVNELIPESTTTPVDISGIKGAIRFDKVGFSYKEGEPILQDLSFSIKPGQKIAIVGSTGAGKTTIANILTRLWDIQSGQIWLDGVPVSAYRLNDLRAAVMPIQQEMSLFSQSIRENILLGKKIGDEEIWQLLEAIQAKDFIAALPEGLDTVLSERGTNLSTGQRQLLAFARILAQNPRIIILDEATANIDTETESRIQKALSQVLSGRTSLIIAHRLSTIRDADEILVLSKGKVIEQGNHSALMNIDGVYSRLYRLQFEKNYIDV